MQRKKLINIDEHNTVAPKETGASPFSLAFGTVPSTDDGNQYLVSHQHLLTTGLGKILPELMWGTEKEELHEPHYK